MASMATVVPLDELPWRPLSVAEAASRFARFPGPWWIAGGWAIDLFLGRQTREHSDTDVLIPHDHQLHLFETLAGWEIHAAGMPERLRLWPTPVPFPPEVHDIWCRPAADAPWALQIMLLDTDGDRWVFRRDHRISGPLADLDEDVSGSPYLAPEVQLLYKSKNPRDKDDKDLKNALPWMEVRRLRWLADALRLHDPGNPWIAIVDGAVSARGG